MKEEIIELKIQIKGLEEKQSAWIKKIENGYQRNDKARERITRINQRLSSLCSLLKELKKGGNNSQPPKK